ncbi:MAG: hypothetical protein ACOY4R_16250 [Pseudomonadota bacterium]
MTYPVADEEQESDVALRAAAHSRWVQLRKQLKPRDAERRDWIRALLAGERLRCSDGDVFRVDRIACRLSPEEVERWAKEHEFFEALDRLRQSLDEIARTDFRPCPS